MDDEIEKKALVEFGDRLRELRGFLRLNRRAFSELIDARPEELCAFEYGSTQPEFTVLLKISDATTCDIDFLITGRTYTEPERRLVEADNLPRSLDNSTEAPIKGWYWETDSQHRVTKTTRPIKNSRPSEILGKTRWEYLGADLEKNKYWRHHVEMMEAHDSISNFMYRGKTDFFRLSGKPNFGDDQVFAGYRGFAVATTLDEAVAHWRMSF